MKRCMSLVLVTAFAALATSAPRAHAAGTRVKKRGVVVQTKGIDKKYAEAFASIIAEARKEYEKALGLSLPKTLEMQAEHDPKGTLRLWTDGDSCIFLTVSSLDQLGPASKTGVFNIYGLCHELGHMAMYRRMKSLAGLPDGVGEGWAHYGGSVVVDAVAERLGDGIWPEPYDVADVEGLARLKRQVDGKDWSEVAGIDRAAKVFYEVEKRHGRQTVGKAMDRALSKKPSGGDLMTLFVEALRKITGNASAGDWIPKEVLTSTIKWNVQERKVNDDFFADQKAQKDKKRVHLSYDDGAPDGQRSSAGSGHAVLFQAPKGNWAVDAVSIFGTRYGTPQAPKENFQIYICDEDFQPLAEVEKPYGLLTFGRKQWHEIAIDPVKVPQRFYVCVSFNPTAKRGFFMAYDDSVSRSHSRSALPYSHVADVQGAYDWMIRVHLRKAGRK